MANQDALNSLRGLINPQDNVKFELNLNKHPKAYPSKSLTYALNMKLSDDGSVLQNDETLSVNSIINETLTSHYKHGDYKIIHILPCNTELVLFVKRPDNNLFDIWRYRENTKQYNKEFALFYNKGIIYNGGEFSSAFTYTSNDSLIIIFCEYDSEDNDILNPIMTINLGAFTKGELNLNIWIDKTNTFNDRELESYKFPICPEVSLPQISNKTIVKGQSYTGIYYFYIRYKINQYDYTQWFSFGYPIEHIHKDKILIHKNILPNEEGTDGFFVNEKPVKLAGANATTIPTNEYSVELNTFTCQDKDLLNSCISLNISHNNILYDKFQIGCICVAKTYTKYYRTSDINCDNLIKNVIFDINSLIEEQFNISTYHNYYNVKTIINKKNKIYIANYKEKEYNNINVDEIETKLFNCGSITNESTTEGNLIIDGKFIIKDKFINSLILSKTFKNYQGDILDRLDLPTSRYGNSYEEEYYKFVPLVYYLHKINKLNLIEQNNLFYNTKVNLQYRWHIATDIASISEKFVNVNEDVNIYDYYIYVSDNIKIPGEEGYHPPYGDRNPENYNNKIFIIIKLSDFDKVGVFWNSYKSEEDLRGIIVNRNFANTYIASEYRYLDITKTLKVNNEDISDIMIPTKDLNPNSEQYETNPYQTIDKDLNNNIITGLVKGEIYDFYIHFIDKYGEVTPGYRLTNKSKRRKTEFTKLDGSTELLTCSSYRLIDKNGKVNKYLIYSDLPLIWIDDENINHINISIWSVRKLSRATRIINDIYTITESISEEERQEIINSLSKLLLLPQSILSNLKVYDIFDTEYNPTNFLPFINSEGHCLFQVPIDIPFTEHIINNKPIYNINKKENIYGLSINNVNLNEYSSYFISYKKLEKRYTFDGFGSEKSITNILLNIINNKIGNIAIINKLNTASWPDIRKSCNIEPYDELFSSIKYITNEYSTVAYAEDNKLNRNGRNSCVYFTQNRDEITPSNNDNIFYDICYIKTFSINKNIYINNNKELYRLGNILIENNTEITEGLNGIYKQHTSIIYGTKDQRVNETTSDCGFRSFGDVFLFNKYDFYDDDINGIYITKSANLCKIIDFGNIKEKDGQIIPIGENTFYKVIDTLDMFDNKLLNLQEGNLSFYYPYKDNDYIYEFNRTIYRSNVISDESKQNNWRFFETEAYKNIEENKGNITNLISTGNYLYVHTEHSLFAFSDDNSLSMNNQQLQVSSPDIFDTEYKEQFNTQLGFGGLQDKDAWVVDKFGYIYYNNDGREIIKTYGQSLDMLDKSIYEFLKYYNPDKVKFANDKRNNRILIQLEKNNDIEKTIILSYNYKYNKFISIHNVLQSDFGFEKAFNTKENLYILNRDKNGIYNFISKQYGKDNNDDKEYKASFIINNNYDRIKYLEFIYYKLIKRNSNDENNININIYPIEKDVIPYSGETMRIFNDLIDTDIIDITTTIDSDTNKPNNKIQDYEKPNWNLGNWNFNYFRDKYNKNIIPNEESRLYGNYFVIEFNFGSLDELIEFENLQVRLTEDKTI